jgi:hypothetical protein
LPASSLIASRYAVVVASERWRPKRITLAGSWTSSCPAVMALVPNAVRPDWPLQIGALGPVANQLVDGPAG